MNINEARKLHPNGKTTKELASETGLKLQGVYAASCRLKLKQGIDYIRVEIDNCAITKFYFAESVERIKNRSTKRTGRRRNPNTVRKVPGKVGRPKKVVEYVDVENGFSNLGDSIAVRCESNVKFQFVFDSEIISEGNFADMMKLFRNA